ncbi:MAG: AAA family ATPase [Phycisphaerales bacterium]
MTLATDQASRLRALMDAPALRARQAPATNAIRQADESRPASPAPRHGARVIAIASGKGGVGKTSIAVNLAIALAATRLRTTLIDADLGVANADVLCGLSPAARIERVLCQRASGGNASLSEIGIAAPGGFTLVPGSAGLGRMADLNTRERQWLVEAMVELESSCDVVLIDTGAGVGALVRAMLGAADLGLVVATPEPTSIADAYALIKSMRPRTATTSPPPAGPSADASPLALIVNQAADEREARAVHERIAGVCRRFLAIDPPMAGWVAQDPLMARAVRSRRPILLDAPSSPAARAIARLACTVSAMAALRIPTPVDHAAARPRRWWSALARW